VLVSVEVTGPVKLLMVMLVCAGAIDAVAKIAENITLKMTFCIKSFVETLRMRISPEWNAGCLAI